MNQALAIPERPNLLQRLVLKAAQRVFSGAGGGNQPGAWGWAAGNYPRSGTYDYVSAVGDPWQNSAVSICLSWISDNLPEPELQVVRKQADGTEKPMVGHPLIGLLETPNPDYEVDALLGATALSLAVDGNAYWLKVRSAAGKLVELWYIPHWQMEPNWPLDGSEFISDYLYAVDGRLYRLAKSDVVHFRDGLDPRNPRKGLGRLKAVLREIDSDNEGTTYTAAILRKTGVPGAMMCPKRPEDELDAPQAKRLKALYEQQTTGDERGSLIVPTMPMELTPFSHSPEEMALDKLRQVPEDRICAALRVPPMVAGLTSGAAHKTYANYGEAREAAYEECLIPLNTRQARTIRKQILLPDFAAPATDYVRHDYSRVRVLQEDRTALYKRVALVKKERIFTPNEARAELGKPPIAGGDKLDQPQPALPPGTQRPDPEDDADREDREDDDGT